MPLTRQQVSRLDQYIADRFKGRGQEIGTATLFTELVDFIDELSPAQDARLKAFLAQRATDLTAQRDAVVAKQETDLTEYDAEITRLEDEATR